MTDHLRLERERNHYRVALERLKDYADAAIAGSGRWSPLEVANAIRDTLRAAEAEGADPT